MSRRDSSRRERSRSRDRQRRSKSPSDKRELLQLKDEEFAGSKLEVFETFEVRCRVQRLRARQRG